MSCFHLPVRALIPALGLSLLLLAGGPAVVPPHDAVAAGDATGETDGAVAADAMACVMGFDQVDSKVGMSLHGVTLLGRGAMAVGYARQSDDDDFGRRTPATLLNDGSQWSRVSTTSPGNEDGLMAVATQPGAGTWAVGWTTVDGRVMPLAMRWTGSGWKTDRPRVRGSLASVFTDVTIVGDDSPFAVGYRMTANGKRQPLVIRRDGKRWRNIPIKIGKRESVTLTAVTLRPPWWCLGRRPRRCRSGDRSGHLPAHGRRLEAHEGAAAPW